ncbi:N-terminal methionine N(alpha)-acetyltransferase NatE [Malassezia sp. CBS 17886]|nr:N-terminal methionine N(alpha)-acetyltransferase NatE [Malassezia sp. CBS 17886]
MSADAFVFKKRARGARDVRVHGSAGATGDDESRSVVVTKRARGDDTAERGADAPRVFDRFGATGVHVAARASGTAENDNRNQEDATRQTDWDLEAEFAQELGRTASAANGDGLYRGMKGYAKYTEERDDGTSAKFKAKGPVRAPSNVRTVTVFDYQPDICKDYKETGYCGFGDTCKFLHDRSDYLAGWQLNEDSAPADARAGTFGLEDEDEDEDVPFACLICREPFSDPVVTLCGHYFCASCAIRRFAKTPKCFACGEKTKGLFNSATKILDRMNRRNQTRAEERRERRRLHGLDEGDEGGAGAAGGAEEGAGVGHVQLLDGVVVEENEERMLRGAE